MSSRSLALALLCSLIGVTGAYGAVSFSGSGPAEGGNASANAVFTIQGDILTIVLTNTTSAATANNGQVITGVIWDFSPNLLDVLSLFPDSMSNPTLTSGSHTWVVQSSGGGQTTYAINDAIALGGTWTNSMDDQNFANAGLGDYGYATTGIDLFQMGEVVGNKPGSANYGLVSDSTFGAGPTITLLSNQSRPQSLPVVQDSITIQFKYNGADLANFVEGNITGAKFLVGTSGNFFNGTEELPPPPESEHPLPEPTSVLAWFAAIAGCGVVRFRRRAMSQR